jgi:tripartite-type tricarboxylate transporter receptor subunit TctC
MVARLRDFDAKPLPMSPTEFGKFIVDETAKWAEVIKFADIHVR